MSALHPTPELPPHLLRALGELFVAVVELDAVLSRASLGADEDGIAWRKRALAASDESRRVARACATGQITADAVVVRSVDGSRVAMSSANVRRLAGSIGDLARLGQLLGGGSDDLIA